VARALQDSKSIHCHLGRCPARSLHAILQVRREPWRALDTRWTTHRIGRL